MTVQYIVPTISPQDKRDHKCIILENGLKVSLISDRECTKAAACMNVHVGALSDPDDIPGLAHFLEHMLFLGTEKFPSETEYSSYIQGHSGRKNASTGPEETNYYFDIDPNFLYGALERFSQFFTCPLFTESATSREINAVDSEHSKNIQEDSRRFHALFRELCKPHHPLRKFATGNLETLGNVENLRQRLLDFHKTYYSASIMSLCIIGKNDLQTLEKWVLEFFASIVSNGRSKPVFQGSGYIEKESLPLRVLNPPVKNWRSLYLLWPLKKSYKEFWREKPDGFITHLLGHEGNGSVLSCLRKRGWANDLNAGFFKECTFYSVLSCQIQITEKGFEHKDEIVRLVFQYIKLMVEGLNHSEWIYNEVKKMSEISFRFLEKKEPIEEVQTVTEKLLRFPTEEIFRAGSVYFQFSQELILEILNQLTPDNLIIYDINKHWEDKTNQMERWLQAPYAIEKISGSVLDSWRSPQKCEELFLRERNPFIPDDFTLFFPHEGLKWLDRKEYPHLIADTPQMKCYYQGDVVFAQPRAQIRLQFTSPYTYASPRTFILAHIGIEIIQDQMNTMLYPASLAGLHSSLELTREGVQMVLKGFNDKLCVFAKKFLEFIANFKVDATTFSVIVEKLYRKYQDADFKQPYILTNSQILDSLATPRWSNKDKVDGFQKSGELFSITIEEVENITKLAFSEVLIEGLVYGNIKESDCKNMLQDILTILKPKPILPSQYPFARIVKLSPYSRQHPQIKHGENESNSINYNGNKKQKSGYYLRKIVVPNPDDTNSSTYCVYVVGTESSLRRALLDVVVQLVFEPSFSQLRTKEQLGYVVQRSNFLLGNVMAFKIGVQSGTKEPVFLETRIENFLLTFFETLVNMPEENIQSAIQSVITKREEKPHTFSKLPKKYWSQIIENHGNFSRDVDEVEHLKTLKKKDIVEFYHKIFFAKMRKLTVQMYGKGKSIDEVNEPIGFDINEKAIVKVINDCTKFKNSMKLYPVV
eukprot:TRINITY_DN4811_c0_g1_i2.p1 TRINITY_DN4811_c0_g1~~TRINITY_DN4811_c0_g1_i2.p1  ORF type:complete len:988 (+),score=198.79 TRINITY_DN4811_c0_g1_i2:178-3141(+)